MTTQLSKMIFTSALGVVLALGVSFKAQAQSLNRFVDRNGAITIDFNPSKDVIEIQSDLVAGDEPIVIIEDPVEPGGPLDNGFDPDGETQSDVISMPGFDGVPTVPVQSVPEPSATLALLFLTGSGLLVTRKYLS